MAERTDMNLDDAIKTHTVWKMLLRRYIDRPDHSLSPVAVGSLDGCDLGNWLEGDGKKYSNIPEFTALVAGHARFHQAAAEVIRRADWGQTVSPEVALGSASPFESATREVVQLLTTLKAKL